jgi:hypothetical protein
MSDTGIFIGARTAMVGIALLLVGAAPAPTIAQLAGLYEIHQMEMGGGLELQPNGHFRYALEYGAASEEGEGDWTFDGKSVRLTSNPKPHEPDFVLLHDEPAPACEVSIAVDWGKLNWSSAPNVLVTFANDPKIYLIYADDSGKLETKHCGATSLRPLVPIYQNVGTEVKLAPDKGHKLSFRFEPNEIGRPAFRGEPLEIDGQGLVFARFDTRIRFVRARP